MDNLIQSILKYLIVILLVVTVELALLWVIPIKKGLTDENFDIDDYVKPGNVAIRASMMNVTEYTWEVKEYGGIKNCPQDIDITGNVPDDWLKTQVDDFYDVDFLFIGKFDDIDPQILIVEEWYTVGRIKRPMYLMWYPPYGLNIFEHDFD